MPDAKCFICGGEARMGSSMCISCLIALSDYLALHGKEAIECSRADYAQWAVARARECDKRGDTRERGDE